MDYDEETFEDDKYEEEEDTKNEDDYADDYDYEDMYENKLADIIQDPNLFQVPHETEEEQENNSKK